MPNYHIWKGPQHHYSSEERKLKPPWDTVVHPAEWLTGKVGQIPSWEGVQQPESPAFLIEVCIYSIPLENCPSVSTKNPHRCLLCDPAVSLLDIHLKEYNTFAQEELHKDGLRSSGIQHSGKIGPVVPGQA